MKRPTNPQKNQVPKVVDDCHELLCWLIPHLDKFPRNRRFTLGERLETELLEVLAACTSAAYARRKRSFLENASQRLAVAQHLWRLAYELQTIPGQKYRVGSQQLVSLGAQVGGWLKLARQTE